MATISLVEPSSADSMAVEGVISGTSALLQAEVPRVVKAISRQLKEKSVKTRVAAFNCLRQLVSTLPGCLAEHAATLVPGIDKATAPEHAPSDQHARRPAQASLQPRLQPRLQLRASSACSPRASGRQPCAPGRPLPAPSLAARPAPRRRSRTPRPTRCASRRCSSCSSR